MTVSRASDSDGVRLAQVDQDFPLSPDSPANAGNTAPLTEATPGTATPSSSNPGTSPADSAIEQPLVTDAQPLSLLILQPTPFCNLACDYCYLTTTSNPARMSLAVLAGIIGAVPALAKLPPRLTLVWHAGEPLVVPVDWYRAAFEICSGLRAAGTEIDHSFQTNGTLIDDAWCALIREYDLHIGVSLDGPRHLHDRHRVNRKGEGSFDRTMAGIRRLQDKDIPFHVITVLTHEALAEPDALYEFFADAGILSVAFNIEEAEGGHAASSLQVPDVVARHRHFLRRFRARVIADDHRMRVREFDQALGAVTCGEPRGVRNQQAELNGILTFDWQGNLSAFSPELIGQSAPDYGDFVFGNPVASPGVSPWRSDAFRRAYRDIRAGVEACRQSCDYFDFCGGGAPANKLYELGRLDGTETLYCRLTKKNLVDLMVEELEQELGIAGGSGAGTG